MTVIDFFTLTVLVQETTTEIVFAFVQSVKPCKQLAVPGCERVIESTKRYIWLGIGHNQVKIIRRIQVVADGPSILGKKSYLYNKNIL